MKYESDRGTLKTYTVTLNDLLRAERYDHKIVDGQMVPFSETLSYQGLEATFTIHLRNPDFAPVRDKLIEALHEYAQNKYANAMTDAGYAIQQYLTLKGFPGHTIGAQVIDAVAAGFITKEDKKLWDWLREMRNDDDDAHPGSPPSKELAWSYLEILGSVFERYEAEAENS